MSIMFGTTFSCYFDRICMSTFPILGPKSNAVTLWLWSSWVIKCTGAYLYEHWLHQVAIAKVHSLFRWTPFEITANPKWHTVHVVSLKKWPNAIIFERKWICNGNASQCWTRCILFIFNLASMNRVIDHECIKKGSRKLSLHTFQIFYKHTLYVATMVHLIMAFSAFKVYFKHALKL